MIGKDVAIKVENLGKRYRIGLEDEIHDSIVAAFIDLVKSPWKNYKKISLTLRFQGCRIRGRSILTSECFLGTKRTQF